MPWRWSARANEASSLKTAPECEAPDPGQSRAELSLRVFNLLDTRYAAGGYMDYDALGNLVPQFVPAATRNVLGQVRVGF